MPAKWRGQTATIEATGGSLPTDPIGVLQNVTITAPNQQVEELRGTGDTSWVDLQKVETAVELSGEVMAWDAETFDRFVDYDDVAGELDSSAAVTTFTITVDFEDSNGNTKSIPCENAYLNDSIELGVARDDWVGMSLNFRCQDFGTISNP